MTKKTKSIVRRNFRISMAFGILMGCVFPVYARFFVVFKSTAMMAVFTVGCIFAGIAVGCISFLITRLTILKTVALVSSEMELIAGGEADLTKQIRIDSNDGIGELVRRFNQFIDRIRTLVSLTQKSASDSSSFSKSLMVSMEKVSESIDGIITSVEFIEGKTQKQNEEMHETKDALKSLNKAVLSVITHVLELFTQMDSLMDRLVTQSAAIDKVISAAEHTGHVIGDDAGSEDMSLSSVSSDFIRNTEIQLEKSQEHLRQLKSVITGIEDILSNTSILAINASIEAARVGRDGAGFKVIASEIHSLASEQEGLIKSARQSIELSTAEIGQSVETINVSKDNYVSLFKETKTAVGRVMDLVGGIKENTSDVRDSYTDISQMLEEIRSSLDTLDSSTKITVKNLEELEKSSTIIKGRTESMTADSIGIKRITAETFTHANALESAIRGVNDFIKEYKV